MNTEFASVSRRLAGIVLLVLGVAFGLFGNVSAAQAGLALPERR